MIRMKPEDAIKAGLLDPLLVSKDSLGGEAAGAGDLNKSKSRKSPKPARSLVKGNEIPGDGNLVVDPQGVVQQAFLDLKIQPVPKERPRVVKNPRTGKIQSFTPRRTAAFHVQVHRVLDKVMEGHRLMDGPLRVDMTFRMSVPVSWPKWKKEAALLGLIRPTGRPDMDNLEKALLDAFNDHIISDDALVIERFARKIYAETAGIEASVSRILAGDVHVSRSQVDLLMRLTGICGE